MEYATEEQQAEALQQFWKNNGKTILLGVCLGIIGIFGWQYYKQYQLHQMENTTEQYMYTIEKINNNYNENTLKAVSDFIDTNKGSSYSEFAAMNLATVIIEKSTDYALAEKYLKIAAGSKDSALSNVAKLRLARVQNQLEKYAEAEATVKSVKDKLYAPVTKELLGDIALAKGDLDAARAAYQEAYDLIKNTNEEKMNVMLKIKLDDLAVAKIAPSSATENKTEPQKTEKPADDKAAQPAAKAETKAK